jgi:hypothetical protein
MRGRLASIAAAATILGLVLTIWLFGSAPTSWTLRKLSPTPVTGHAPYTGQPDPSPWNPPSPKEASQETPAERLIVKVKFEGENVSWMKKLEPTWQNEFVTVESMYLHLHAKAHRPDRGRIASAYLTWIIENYNHLPETVVFLPSSDPFDKSISGLHSTISLYNSISSLQTPFVQSSGFANLHCPTSKSRTTCNNKVLNSEKPSYELRTLETQIVDVWKECFGEGIQTPARIASVLGSEFVVSREQMKKRSVEEYLKLWSWLNSTVMDDDSAGLVFEYIWHVVFGKDAIFCPEQAKCECDLHGRC